MIEAFLVAAIALILMVVLPILSYRRATEALYGIERLHRRLDDLEARLRQGEHATSRGVPTPDPTPPAPAPAAAEELHAQASVVEPSTPVPAASTSERPKALEARIGGRWMLYIGVGILIIGAALLVRYAFANAWITEPVRVLVGLGIGALLVWAGRRFSTAGHRTYGHALAGGGLAIWYLSVYAAVNLYGLIGPGTGFTMLLAVTGLGALQAARARSQGLAMLAVAGGFATPWMVGVGTTAPFMLLAYTALLVGATVLLAHNGDWPMLNLVSFLLTGLTLLVWMLRSYSADDYATTEAFFTLFCALFLWVLRRMQRSTHPAAPLVRLALWTTPVWYHLASLAILESHWLAFLIYLIGFTGVGLVAAVRSEAMWLRLPLWAAVVLPLLAWSDGQPDASWLTPAVVTWVAVAGSHGVAQVELLRRAGARLHPADVLLAPLSTVTTYVGLRALLDPLGYSAAVIALPLGVAVGVLGWWVNRVDPRATGHYVVSAIAVTGVGLATLMSGPWFPVWLALQGTGLLWVGLTERRDWIRGLGLVLVLGAASRAIELQFGPVPAGYDVFLNHRAGIGLLITALLAMLAVRHARTSPDADPLRHGALASTVVGANLMLLITLSAEIHAFWELRAVANVVASAELVRQMMLSATWAAYAAALTAIGIRRAYPPVRYLALVIFAVTIVKLFVVDFSQLDSVYRIVSSLALGLLLVGASYLYQRYGTAAETSSTAPTEPS